MATSDFHDASVGPTRIFIWFMVALLASVSVGGVLQHMEVKFYSDQTQAENTAKTELLRAAMLEDIITEDRGRLETTVEVYQESNPNFQGLTVKDEDGNALLSWSRDVSPHPQRILMFFKRFYPHQRSVVPVVFEGEIYGEITSEWNQSSSRARRDSHVFAMAGVVGSLCFIFAFVGYRVGRRHH